jgi:hypothetical protein
MLLKLNLLSVCFILAKVKFLKKMLYLPSVRSFSGELFFTVNCEWYISKVFGIF